jgi:hypothetical protein
MLANSAAALSVKKTEPIALPDEILVAAVPLPIATTAFPAAFALFPMD